jgi:phage shock protein A
MANISIQDIMAHYEDDIRALTRRAVLAEVQVSTMEHEIQELNTKLKEFEKDDVDDTPAEPVQ